MYFDYSKIDEDSFRFFYRRMNIFGKEIIKLVDSNQLEISNKQKLFLGKIYFKISGRLLDMVEMKLRGNKLEDSVVTIETNISVLWLIDKLKELEHFFKELKLEDILEVRGGSLLKNIPMIISELEAGIKQGRKAA